MSDESSVAAVVPPPRRYRRALAVSAVLGVVMAGLSVPAYAADTYNVDIVGSGDGGFTGQGSYAPGDTVTLTATPGEGAVWGGWSSDELGWIGARTTSFTMPAGNVELETSFRPQAAPLKDAYDGYFKLGSIWSNSSSFAEGSAMSNTLQRNFNVLTAENAMKPDQLLPNNNINPTTGAFTFNWTTADNFVRQANERGSDVHGHVLVWHGQSPARLNTGATGGTRSQAKENMRRYIEAVLTHYSGKIPTWDVVNEAFVDELASFDPATQNWRDFLRGGPNGGSSDWYKSYANGADVAAGETPSDFLYDAFVFARKYGPEVDLQYNDFNEFQTAGKMRAIVAMAKDLNARYAAEYPEDPRHLIETIGMQSHVYINQSPAFACSTAQLPNLVNPAAESWQTGACSDTASIEGSIQEVVDAGLKVAISELDLQVWEAWNGQPEGDSNFRDLTDPTVKDRISRGAFTFWVGKIQNRAELEAIQAQRFAEYMSVYKKYSDHISRVTFWGVNDRFSWRATHNPLLLNTDFSEKLAMWAVSDPAGWFARNAVDDGSIPVEATVPEAAPGNLSLTVADFGSGVVLEQGTNAGDRLRFGGQLPGVTVNDSRNAAQAGNGGWALTGRSSKLTSTAGSVTADHLGWQPHLAQPRAGVTQGAAVATKIDGGLGLSVPASLASAVSEGRFGSTQVGAGLLLEVPIDTAPGTYKGALTVSLFPVD